MRPFRPAVAVGMLLALVTTSCTGAKPAPRQSITPSASVAGTTARPNVVILLSDDQAFRIFDRDLMPNVFGRLVDQGVYFTRAYVNVSQCCPSRASILTGLYAHDSGVDSNETVLDGRTPIRPVFPLALQEAGYRTGLFGKYLNSEPCHPQPGWTKWVCSTGGSEVDPPLNIDGHNSKGQGYTADILAEKAVSFIQSRQNPNKPFFVYYSPKDPHLPADDPRDNRPVPPYLPPSFNANPDPASRPAWTRLPPLDALKQTKIQNWHTKMTRQIPPLDAAMGTILEAIKSRARDTLVIFLSDNGFMYGEHRLTSKNQPYEEAVRVPVVIRYPRVLPPSAHFRSDALVSNVDIAPTVMEAAGLPWEADGTSLLPLLSRKTTKVRDGVLIEWCQAGNRPVCQSEGRAEELNLFELPHLWGIETDRYVYIEYGTGESELYDLRKDPYEMTNLAGGGGHVALKRRLAKQLAALRAPPPTPGTTIASGPSGTVFEGDVAFVFFSQARTTTFRCRLDGPGQAADWTPCNQGIAGYQGLGGGRFAFTVQAVDDHGRADPTPAVRRFTVSG